MICPNCGLKDNPVICPYMESIPRSKRYSCHLTKELCIYTDRNEVDFWNCPTHMDMQERLKKVQV